MKNKILVIYSVLKILGISQGLLIIFKIITKTSGNIHLSNIKFPILLRPNTSDFSTFCQIFLKKEYEVKIPIIPKVIIDGGANIGLFTIIMKNRFVNAQIICIEPDPDNFVTLIENVKNYENIIMIKAALWNKNIKLKLNDKFNLGKWGMMFEEDCVLGDVNGISINSLLNEYKIDFIDILKLDIETSEKNLFSENYENLLPKCKIIIIELHDRIEKGCTETFFKAINKCFKKYETQILGENIIITNQDLN